MSENGQNIPARVPPQAVEVEESVLGSAMIEAESADQMFMRLQESDFYKPAHQLIFSAMRSLYDHGQPMDMLSIETELKKSNGMEQVGGSGYLADLTRAVSSAANVDHHCQIIKEKAVKRNLIKECSDIITMCYKPDSDAYEVVDEAQSSVFSVVDAGGGHMRKLSESLNNLASKVHQIQEDGVPLGLRTGLDMDKYIAGFQGSKLYVIGARPSMGKTALVMTIMRRFARDEITSGILSLETSDESIATRLVAQTANLQAERITSGNMTPKEEQKFIDACKELYNLKIYIDDEPALTAQKARSKCRLLVKKGVKIIFIDFLQLMHANGRSKHEEIGTITKILKQTSKELDIPIVVLSQLSRKVEDRNDKHPQMADLRESGSIEEDADCIMFLYRPEYYGFRTTPDGRATAGLAHLILAKNKDGKTGLVDLRFIGEYMRFENIEHVNSDPVEEIGLGPKLHRVTPSDMDDNSPF